jgi:hypothetical protein
MSMSIFRPTTAFTFHGSFTFNFGAALKDTDLLPVNDRKECNKKYKERNSVFDPYKI